MYKTLTVIALSSCALWLSGCDQTPPMPPAPVVSAPVPGEPGAMAAPAASTSVPSAESVLPPATAAQTGSAQGRSNSTMSATQEAAAMPMPGQNNDHSAPVSPAKRASAP